MNKPPIYLGLVINPKPSNPKDTRSFLERLNEDALFEALVITKIAANGIDAIFHKVTINFIIRNISIGPNGLHITFSTRGTLPPGLKCINDITVTFDKNFRCRNLPEALYIK